MEAADVTQKKGEWAVVAKAVVNLGVSYIPGNLKCYFLVRDSAHGKLLCGSPIFSLSTSGAVVQCQCVGSRFDRCHNFLGNKSCETLRTFGCGHEI